MILGAPFLLHETILNFPVFPRIISDILGRVTCNKLDASSAENQGNGAQRSDDF
jgi:hypothetical protein